MSTYTLWCLIEGDKTPFSVTALSTIFIGMLKQEIKEKRSNLLRKVDASELILWKVDVNFDTVKDKIRSGQYKPSVTSQQPLRDINKLSVIWSEPPPDDYLHVFVDLPIKLSPIICDASTRDLWPVVTLRTTSQGNFERLETVGKNKISELHDTEPDFLFDFRTKLVQCRWIESGTEDPAVLLLMNKLHGFDNYFQPAPIDVEQRDRISSELELFHLTFAFIAVAWKEGDIKEANVRWIFDTLGWHFRSILGPRESHAFCGDWPFKIIVVVESEKKRYRYTPRSDFHVSVNGLIYLLVEVQSDKDQTDRYRMLLQAACVARLGRLLHDNPFIVVALYIENSGRVTRYFVFQRDGTDPMVSYVKESQNWNEPFQLFKAIFELYNLISIIQSDRPEGGGIEERIRTLASDISNNFTHTLESKKTQHDTNEDVYQDCQVVESFTRAGYTLESNDEDEKGWELMDQLKPTMRRAKQSNGTVVVVKLLYPGSDELWILQRLHLIKSRINPTIPLLGALESNVGTFVLFPEATPLDLEIEPEISQSKVVDLSNQLIKGVGFLHHHGTAHLDIKPQNIVVLQNRLFIIDFDVSVCVDGPDALIDRWCGTPQWMAPEIGHQNSLYSPIRADLWSCGRVLQYLAEESAVKENPFEALMWLLLSKDPRDRPLLHLWGSDTVGHLLSEPQARLK